MTPVQKSPLLQAAIALMEARNIQMVTSEEWENLAKAVEAEYGERVEWRTQDEIADDEEKGKLINPFPPRLALKDWPEVPVTDLGATALCRFGVVAKLLAIYRCGSITAAFLSLATLERRA